MFKYNSTEARMGQLYLPLLKTKEKYKIAMKMFAILVHVQVIIAKCRF